MTFGQTPHGGGPFPNPRLWISRRTRVGVRGEQLLVWDNKVTAGWWEGHPKGDGKAWLPRVTGRPLEELPQMQSLAAHPAAKLTPLSRLLVRNPLGDLCPHVDVDAEEGGGWGRETPCQAAVGAGWPHRPPACHPSWPRERLWYRVARIRPHRRGHARWRFHPSPVGLDRSGFSLPHGGPRCR